MGSKLLHCVEGEVVKFLLGLLAGAAGVVFLGRWLRESDAEMRKRYKEER